MYIKERETFTEEVMREGKKQRDALDFTKTLRHLLRIKFQAITSKKLNKELCGMNSMLWEKEVSLTNTTLIKLM